MEYRGGRAKLTLSDLLYLCALLAVIVGVAILVGAFLGIIAAVGAALVALSGALFVVARSVALKDG